MLQPLRSCSAAGAEDLQYLFIFLSNAVYSSRLRGVLMKEVGWGSSLAVDEWRLMASSVQSAPWAPPALPASPCMSSSWARAEHLLTSTCMPRWPALQDLPGLLAGVLTPEAAQQQPLAWHQPAASMLNSLLNVEARWAGAAEWGMDPTNVGIACNLVWFVCVLAQPPGAASGSSSGGLISVPHLTPPAQLLCRRKVGKHGPALARYLWALLHRFFPGPRTARVAESEEPEAFTYLCIAQCLMNLAGERPLCTCVLGGRCKGM